MARKKKEIEPKEKLPPIKNWKGKFVNLVEKNARYPEEYYGFVVSQEERNVSGIFVKIQDDKARKHIEDAVFLYDDWDFYPSDKSKVQFYFNQSLHQAEIHLMERQFDLDEAKFDKEQSELNSKKVKF